ncbi:MAG TPA: SIMPL domain-containing protein [Candidatus Omnitrophota bacterium]|nr:SIMPL domain-containing protein [Candidatus Omnitrophota bacterium]HRY86157.1 SIMPL domain-containing protein [Candidatus Omnitrophota bacterium]
MKKNAWIVLVVFGFAALFMSGCTRDAGYGQRLEDSVPTLSVQGQGKVEIVPDEATVRFGVVSDEKTLSKAYQDNTGKMNRAIAAVKAMGIADKDIRTSSYNVRPVYAQDERGYTLPGKPVSFQVSQQLTVVVRDLLKTGAMIDQVITGGVNTFDGIQFTSSRIDDVEKEAKLKAAQNAKEKAQLLAKGLGVKVGRVLKAGEATVYPSPTPMRMMAFDAASVKSSPEIEGGSIEINASCSVIYEIA